MPIGEFHIDSFIRKKILKPIEIEMTKVIKSSYYSENIVLLIADNAV